MGSNIYKVFLKLSPDDKNKFEEKLNLSALGIQLNYDSDHDLYIGLYGWSDDKNLMKKFKSQRRKKYFIYTEDENSYTEDYVKKFYINKLKSIKISDSNNESDNNVEIVVPLLEDDAITDDDMLMTHSDDVFSVISKLPDPMLFKNSILGSLDIMSYSLVFFQYSFDNDFLYENDEDNNMNIERVDAFSYNSSFGINERGQRLCGYTINQLYAFVMLFGEFIRKD